MSSENESQTEENGEIGSQRRKRVAIISILALLTLTAGVAAREFTTPTRNGAAATTLLQYSAATAGPVHFSGQLDRTAVHHQGDGTVKLELVIGADATAEGEFARVATDLVVILDRSGSMQGDPMHHAHAAVRQLIGELAAGDRFALVSYASSASLDIPFSAVGKGAQDLWIDRVSAIRASGGTNMSSGLDLATNIVEDSRASGRSTRIILVSDGHANEGDASFDGLRIRAARAMAGEYVVSAVGVGNGFDEHLMVALANAGTGNFYYVEHADELQEVFTGEFASARESVANALQVVIDLGAGVEVVSASGYPLDRSGGSVRFHPGNLFGGQERRVWVTLRAPTDELGERPLGEFSLSYRTLTGARERLALETMPAVSCVESRDDYFARVDPDAWSRSVVSDDFNAVKEEVARYIQLGRSDEAQARISGFIQKVGATNAQVRSPLVSRQLEEAKDFAADVDAVFAAPAAEQERASKKLSAEGYDGRRVGAKK